MNPPRSDDPTGVCLEHSGLSKSIANLEGEVKGLRRQVSSMWWKLAFLAGALSTAGSYVVSKFGG